MVHKTPTAHQDTLCCPYHNCSFTLQIIFLDQLLHFEFSESAMSAAGRQNSKRYWVSVKFHIMELSKSSSTNSTFYFMFLHNKARHVTPLSIAIT